MAIKRHSTNFNLREDIFDSITPNNVVQEEIRSGFTTSQTFPHLALLGSLIRRLTSEMSSSIVVFSTWLMIEAVFELEPTLQTLGQTA